MRIAICEDNMADQARLLDAITDWANARKVQVDILCYQNAEEFIFVWPDMLFDLTFIDIQMKNMTGIQLAKYIRDTDKNMLLVFVTSHSQYVLSGYDVDALHYLIKPLSLTKLIPIMDKAYMIWRSCNKDAILVSNGAGQFKLLYGNIFYISMMSHIAEIHTDNEVFEIRKTAAELDRQLPTYFRRCHRSYIVNLLKIECIYKDSVMLLHGTQLPVSRSNTKQINDAFVRLYTE
jgi:DNA-binding LytR/AlgR family response regulator